MKFSKFLRTPIQLVIFKPPSYCFKETIRSAVKGSFAQRLVPHLIKPGDITGILRKGYSLPRDFS